MNNQLDKAEFRDYITRNRKDIILKLLLFLFLVFIFGFTFVLMKGSMKLSQGINSLDYNYVIVSDEPAGTNAFVRFLNLNTVKAEHKSINVNTYMQQEQGVYRPNTPMDFDALADDEMVVSQKVAEKLNIRIGSKVQLDFVLTEKPLQYTVKGIVEYVTDYYNIEENSDFSVVLIGFNEELNRSHRNQFVFFLNEEELDEFISNNRSYKELLYIEAEKTSLKHKNLSIEIIIMLVHATITGMYFIATGRSVMREMVRYHYDGFSLKTISCFVRTYRRRFVFFPWLLSVILVLCIGESLLSWQIVLIGVLLELLVYIVLWGRYEWRS